MRKKKTIKRLTDRQVRILREAIKVMLAMRT